MTYYVLVHMESFRIVDSARNRSELEASRHMKAMEHERPGTDWQIMEEQTYAARLAVREAFSVSLSTAPKTNNS